MDFDVVVIGAGAGGLMTAARLAHLGYRTLVAERLEHLGGRASTRDVDGFKVNNGAIVIETGTCTSAPRCPGPRSATSTKPPRRTCCWPTCATKSVASTGPGSCPRW
jgi:cation diffusion facilitator CzcD-associated flavoprotein CzcO